MENLMKNLKEDVIAKIFGAIGKGLKPTVVKTLSKKDPKFAKIVSDLEDSKKKADDLFQQYMDKVKAKKAERK